MTSAAARITPHKSACVGQLPDRASLQSVKRGVFICPRGIFQPHGPDADALLFDDGLYGPASSRQPPGGGIGAISGRGIEGDRRAWGSLMNSVDDGFE